MSAPEQPPATVTDRSPGLAGSAPTYSRPYGPRNTFQVSPEDAVRGNGRECPVAQACRQMWPGCEPHIEGEDPHVILADGTHRPVRLDPRLIEAIGRFDRGEGGHGELGTIAIVGGEFWS